MPIPTPFHPRTAPLCTSLFWKEWAGYHAVRSFDVSHEREYFAIRHAAALIDVTPLFKYDVRGRDAGAFLSAVLVKDAARMRPGRVAYVCWCDDEGKVVDDGTVSRLDEDWHRVTAAEPTLAWLERFSRGYALSITDVSAAVGALSLQGPTSRAVLEACCDGPVRALRFFRLTRGKIAGADVIVSRTGYTGDLGYEIWVENARALDVWDALIEAGRPWRIQPCGLDAMDVSRVEAGFIMNGVDYHSAHRCLIEARKSSPFELGLGWTVDLEREPFMGQRALVEERRRGPRWALTGLRLDWDAYERLFAGHGLPPQVPATAWRDPRPVYDDRGRQVGYATSGAWSPMLKENLALATLEAPHAAHGTRLALEVTVEFTRCKVPATVSATPFFDPPRKRGKVEA